jgi:hypothetical protein
LRYSAGRAYAVWWGPIQPGVPVPVTAKLSRKFYDALGDDVANELVEWFNRVDLTYRTELRDLNEVNFARFDAKLDQRVATLKAEIDQRITALEAKLDRRIVEVRAELRQEVARLDARVEHGFAEQAARVEHGFTEHAARVDAKLDGLRTELIKWMFLFWVGSVGLALAISQLR